jgi:hypothetical protein
VWYNYKKAPQEVEHGMNIWQMGGTSEHQTNITDATESMSRKQEANGYQTQYFSNKDA